MLRTKRGEVSMNESEYYEAVFPKLCNAFEDCYWVLGHGLELIKYGWDPNKLLVTAEPIDQIHKLTVERNLEVYHPIFNKNSVLFAKDAEIYLSDASKLYSNVGSQLHFFEKHMLPVIKHETRLLKRLKVAHMIDLTPSGWHINFKIRQGTQAYEDIKSIGYLDSELREKYLVTVPHDIKRNPAPGLDAGLVFSGIGRLKEYLALRSRQNAKQHKDAPITISDTEEKCVNEDITDCGDPGYMRIMRSPFSLHKKKRRYSLGESLQDIVMVVHNADSNGQYDYYSEDLDYLLACMWDKELAVKHSENITGHIPYISDEGAANLVNEYKNSDLSEFHYYFDSGDELGPWEALNMAEADPNLNDKTKNFIAYPCPRALQPRALSKFIGDMLNKGWHPKHIGYLIKDFYHKNLGWEIDWNKYSRKTRGLFWSRVYSAVAMQDAGEIVLP